MYRYHNDYIPAFLHEIPDDTLKALVKATEMTATNKEGTLLEYRHYIKGQDETKTIPHNIESEPPMRPSPDLLIKLTKPARYTGGEVNIVQKEITLNMTRFAFCFPDVYEIGMSH